MTEEECEPTRLMIYTRCRGDKLWIKNTSCSHTNGNICSTCDFDQYYSNKHKGHCPWEDK